MFVRTCFYSSISACSAPPFATIYKDDEKYQGSKRVSGTSRVSSGDPDPLSFFGRAAKSVEQERSRYATRKFWISGFRIPADKKVRILESVATSHRFVGLANHTSNPWDHRGLRQRTIGDNHSVPCWKAGSFGFAFNTPKGDRLKRHAQMMPLR